MSVDTKERSNAPPEFSVRQTWNGTFVLRVRTFESLPYSGAWMDARPCDLPAFFEYMNKGRAK